MSLEKFFNLIDNSFVGRFVSKKAELVRSTDPNRIYVENIRSFFNINTFMAKFFCEMGVKEGILVKNIGLVCPNEEDGRIIKSMSYSDFKAKSGEEMIVCDLCELNGLDDYEFKLKDLRTIIYYSINE